MGSTLTRNRNGQEDTTEMSTQSAYRYPPKTGSYFGTHFIMGGERFESPQPCEYLFGDSEELNFLGNKPLPFPYPVPSGNDPTKTLKSLVFIRKDSIRLVKAPTADMEGHAEGTPSQYNIEFLFDSDVKCAIRIYYFCSEEMVNGQVVYTPAFPSMCSDVYHYKRGAGQSFSQPSHILDPSKYHDYRWDYKFNKESYPIVIHCLVEEEEHVGHAHVTYCFLEQSSEGGNYTLKPLKQKQVVDGLCYLLQEIYGIENKNSDTLKDVDPDDEVEDSGAECVICMSDMRDTLILPCRHLCLCSSCADSLRYQASMCPICRVKFRALLQIRAMRKKVHPALPTSNTPQSDSEENPVNQEGVPPGYEAISLIEALNGQVVPGLTGEGVPLQISGPPSVFTVEKKGQKEAKVTVSGPIEYQKEMDTDKESNKGTLEKQKDKKLLETRDVTSTEPASDTTPDQTLRRPDYTERSRSPPKATVVTVRCSPDGKMITETKISQITDPTLPVATAAPNKKLHERDYKSKGNMARLACGLSTGDMADDEREDSSEPEPEPEPDYDYVDSDPGTSSSMKSSSHSLYRAASASLVAVDVEGSHLCRPGKDEGDVAAATSRSSLPASPLSPTQGSIVSTKRHAKKDSASRHKGSSESFSKVIAESASTSAAEEGAVTHAAPAYHQVECETSQNCSKAAAKKHLSSPGLSPEKPDEQNKQDLLDCASNYISLSDTGFPDVHTAPGIGTESSSFSSNCSDQALLSQAEALKAVNEDEDDDDEENEQKDPIV